MLGYLISAWFVAGILLSIQVITLKGFRKSLARDPQRLRAIYDLPEGTRDDVLRQAGRYYYLRHSHQLIPWGLFMVAFIAATPSLIFWGVMDYLYGPHWATVAVAAISFAALAALLLRTQRSKSERRFRALDLDPELVARLEKKHFFR